MERPILPPFRVIYGGNDTDSHLLDAENGALSIFGTAKLYNSVLHLYFLGRVPGKRSRQYVRTYCQPPTSGSVDFPLVAATFYDQFLSFQPILITVGHVLISKLIASVLAFRTKREAEVMRLVRVIEQQVQNHQDLANTAIGELAKSRDQLYAIIGRLTEKNRLPMEEMVSPIGSSCTTITHFPGTPDQQLIDEATAEVLRAKEDLEVGPQTEFLCMILGVDKKTRSCRIMLQNGIEVRGKITDPLLETPHNIYTAALDDSRQVIISGKPLLRQGEITKIFISDARNARPT